MKVLYNKGYHTHKESGEVSNSFLILTAGTILYGACYYVMNGTVIYDGECAFCKSQVRFIQKRDRRKVFRFVPLQSDEGRRMLRSAGLPGDEPDTVVYVNEEKSLTRSAAVLGILSDLGGGWSLLRVLEIIPSRIRDFFYRLVARNRHRFSSAFRQGI